jgi:phosphate-selective porin OprO and OprP
MRHRVTIRLRLLTALTAAVIAAAHSSPASAQPTESVPPPTVQPGSLDEQRLSNVENQLNQLLESQNKTETASDPKPTFDLGGQVQIDYIFPGQDAVNRATVGDAQNVFGFRRARLTASGEALDVVTYAIGFDFALSGHPSFMDNWIAVQDLPFLGNVRVGRYFEPFSLERYTQNRYNTFMERSLADAFAPARSLGLMAHDTLGIDERATWAIGWFRSDTDDFGNSVSDNGGWAVTSRATWLPLYDVANDGRTLLHVGAAYTYRSAEEGEVSFSSFPEARTGDENPAAIPLFVDTGTIAALSDQRIGTEIALVHGPFYVQAEYIGAWVDQSSGPGLLFHGAYAYVSYFLTGEHRTYDRQRGTLDRVYPYENFFRVATDHGVATGRGAWEIAARWSVIDLNSANVRGGTLNDVTLGLNWHLNPYTRMRWEYIHAQLNRAPVGLSEANIFGMRFDIDF